MREKEMQTARRGLGVYFAVLITGTAFFEWRILQTGESIHKVPLLIIALMYIPAAASVVARLSLREGFGDVSFRWGSPDGGRAVLLAWVYPIVVGVVAYGVGWAAHLAAFQAPLPPGSHLDTGSATLNLLASFLVSATLGTVLSCFSAFGEELGWRGYMLTRLMTAGIPRPVLVSGLIWALWHVPLILSGQYAAESRAGLSATLFVIGVIADGYLAAFLRLRWGSIWPAVMMHGAWNAIIQGTFDRATVGTPFSVGESGWLTVIVSISFVLVVTRGVWTLQRRPGEELIMPSGKAASTLTL
ncbi:MAG: CPBP family intramembrane metalloprotease [Acidobacteriia bacterium]|nr:CPBP family intramembrane metalloprotease [Terriglobia bacterium]